jgi:hypothetical protein
MRRANKNKGRKRTSKSEQTGGPLPLVRLPRKEMVYTTELHSFSGVTDISVPNLNVASYTTISAFNGSTPLLGVFDQYRILNVTFEWIPLCVTSFIAAGTIATVVPTNVYNHNVLSSCVDTDDATATSEADVLAHESCVLHGPFIRPFKRSYVPAIAVEVYQTGGFGGYANRTNQWLDSGSSNVQHYGIKFNLNHGTIAPTGTVTMATYQHATVEWRKRF